jgi:recombination protein RecR
MAYHLLLSHRKQGMKLADSISEALKQVRHCEGCNDFTTEALCHRCKDSRRIDSNQLCIVEMPTDVLAIEQSGVFKGRYFVLMGRLSPLDGIGPEKLSIDKLHTLMQQTPVKEVIFAINPSVEGEATVYYLSEQLRRYSVTLSQLASGVPVGGELEYLNASTIGKAILKRSSLETME